MENVTTTATSGLSETLQAFYDTELLENAKPAMVYAQLAKVQPLPAGNGNTVQWRKWNNFEKAEQLTEGVIPDGQMFGLSTKTATLNQYGTYTAITDHLEMSAYDDVILAATEEMGASAAETQESLIRDVLLTGTNVMYCDTYDTTTGAFMGQPTGPYEMRADDIGQSFLTAEMVAKAATKLKKDRVPTINGCYYAVIHPSVAHDLRMSEGWMEAYKYANPDAILNGEIGQIHGVRFIENVYAPVLTGVDYGNIYGLATYVTFFFGKDAFGIVDPEGGALQMIVHDKSEIGGPLNQYSTIGYKLVTNGATILYPERVLQVWSTSSFTNVDEANAMLEAPNE